MKGTCVSFIFGTPLLLRSGYRYALPRLLAPHWARGFPARSCSFIAMFSVLPTLAVFL